MTRAKNLKVMLDANVLISAVYNPKGKPWHASEVPPKSVGSNINLRNKLG
jgi:predicted nucleic acid-binding protein